MLFFHATQLFMGHWTEATKHGLQYFYVSGKTTLKYQLFNSIAGNGKTHGNSILLNY